MKKDGQYKLDIVPGVILALFSALYMSNVPGIQAFKGLGSTPINNRFVPWLWGGSLMLLSLWLIVRGVLKYRRFTAANARPVRTSLWRALLEKREVIASFAALTLYVVFMEPVGFILATIAYTFVQILLLTPVERWGRNLLPAAVTAIITGFLLFYVFRRTLGVLLPAGTFGEFML